MAGEVNFSGKLAKSIDLSSITVENLDETKKKEIEKIFNTVTGGNSATTLTTDELVVLSDADKNHDGKITDAEAKAAYDKLADDVKQGLTAKQVTQNDYVAYLKAMAKKNEELIAQESNVGNGYTVQLGEDLDDLIDRIIEANKVPEDKKAKVKEDYKKAILAANKDNGAIKFDSNGNVKWLVAGAKIILPTMTQDGRADKRVKDQNNKTAVENKYRAWRAGKIQSFRYSINADGQASEVRSSGSTNFDVTRDYNASSGEQEGVVASHDPADDGDVETVDMSKIVLIGKITEEDCVDDNNPDKKYDLAEVKAKAEKGREILAKLNNPENIKSCTAGTSKYDNEQVEWYYIEFEDGSKVILHMTKEGEIDGIGNSIIRDKKDATLWINMDDSNNVYDVKIQGGVKDFDKLVGLVKQSGKVREAMGLASKDFVNFDKIIDDEMPDGVSASDVKDKVKLANQVLTKLENPSDVKGVKSENKDGGKKELTITLKDDTVVKAEVGADGKVVKVTVQYKDSSEPDATYDLEHGHITVKVGDQDVTTTGVIKNKDAIEKFVLNAKTEDGAAAQVESTSELPYNINHFETEGTELGEMLYNQVKGSSGNATTRRFLKQIDEMNVHSVVTKFNSLSSGEHIIKYLVNESGIKNEDIAHVIDSIITCAEKYNLQDTDAYADLKGYKKQIDDSKSSDPSDVDWAEDVDNAVESLLNLIKKTANEKGAEYKVSDITAPDKFLRNNKTTGRDVGLSLYNEVHGSSSTEDTRTILRDIKEDNVYYVIERFNEKSPDENIIKYLVNESNITYGNLTCVIGNALLCAKQYGLENTKEYRDVKAYQNFCYNAENKNIDPDDEDWADRVDTALKALMAKVNERAASRGEELS